MRWSEIAELTGSVPTYRQLDTWTRAGRLTANMQGDRWGRYRDWSADQVGLAMRATKLINAGLTVDAAFSVAGADTDTLGRRSAEIEPGVTVTLAAGVSLVS
jgi:hypothetical protein